MIKKLVDKFTKEKPKSYKFKWRRLGLSLPKSKTVIGHKYFHDQNKMVLYLINGGIYEIPAWDHCGASLGSDWVTNSKPMKETENEEV